MSSSQCDEACCLSSYSSFVMHACVLFFFSFSRGTLEIITVTWLSTNIAQNKQPQSVTVGEKFPGIPRRAHANSTCHILVVTLKCSLIKNICLLLRGNYLFCCSLAIQPVAFCFEGQEFIKTLIG